MYKLIPLEERHKYHCCICGETRSVKYFIPTCNPCEGKGIQDLAYCNKCALLYSMKNNKGDVNHD